MKKSNPRGVQGLVKVSQPLDSLWSCPNPIRPFLMCALLAGPFGLSRVTNVRLVLCSVDSCVAHGAIYSFGFIALGRALRCNRKPSTHPNADSLCLIIKLLSGDMGEQ